MHIGGQFHHETSDSRGTKSRLSFNKAPPSRYLRRVIFSIYGQQIGMLLTLTIMYHLVNDRNFSVSERVVRRKNRRLLHLGKDVESSTSMQINVKRYYVQPTFEFDSLATKQIVYNRLAINLLLCIDLYAAAIPRFDTSITGRLHLRASTSPQPDTN